MAQKRKKKATKVLPRPTYEQAIKGPRIIKSEYKTSAVEAEFYPEGDTVEVAFLGRSNVGKSSLINSLCNHRGLALVSRQPGKTKTINFFDITSKEDLDEGMERRLDWFLVDLPGYGFAKTGKGNEDRNIWSSFISDYIFNSERLMLLCLLIDGRHPDLEIDMEAYDWLIDSGVPLQIVITKTDKLNNKERNQALSIIKDRYPTDTPPIMYSALKHTGRNKLINRINEVLG